MEFKFLTFLDSFYLKGKLDQLNMLRQMEELGINVKINEENFAIFNYNSLKADFSNPIVQEARGIIVNLSTREVLCWPFDKFFNYHEENAAAINWERACVEEKIDGSIVKLWYYDGKWNWSTNSCIYADEATINGSFRNFLDIILSAKNYSDINFNNLETQYTYIFELVSPQTKVVIDYPYPYLYHLGTRNNLTGEEVIMNIGVETPQLYSLQHSDLESVLDRAEKLNEQGLEHEGFVICDDKFNRVKVKNDKYLKAHYMLNNKVLPKKKIVEALIQNDEEFLFAVKQYPYFEVAYKYYDWQVAKFLQDLNRFLCYSRKMYLLCDENRKDFAMKVKDECFAPFAFRAIDHPNDSALDIVKRIDVKRILPFIGTYDD